MINRLIKVCLALLAAGTVMAQQPVKEPEALKTLRDQFHQRLLIASGSLNDFYSRALATSETYFAAKGDYAQARAIKARREDLAAIGLQAATASSPIVVTLPLPAETAHPSGVVTGKSGELANWRTAACGAEWTLTKFVPGTYQIMFRYTMTARPAVTGSTKPAPDAPSAQTYIFKESSLLGAAKKNECTVTLATNKDPTLITSEGTIELRRPPMTLKLAAAAAYPGNSVVIRDVKLIQAAPLAANATTTTPTVVINLREQLAKLKTTLPDLLSKERQPVIDDYTKKLDALAKAAPKDASLASQIETEKRHAKKALGLLTTKATTMLNSFDEFSDVQFVPDPANTGDSFKVVTKDGKTMRLRLAFISCPSNDPAAREMKLTTERFGIDVETALNLARDAQTFAAEYLQGHPLDLLVRHEGKEGEALPAFVFIDNIGLFQNVLIDHGLAVVDAPTNGKGKATTREGEYLTLLREREAQARKQVPKPGGWGLGNRKL